MTSLQPDSPDAPGERGLWASVGMLLRMRLRIQLNTFRRASLRARIGMALLALLSLLFLGSVVLLSFLLLRFLRSPALALYVNGTNPFLETVPAMLVSGACGGILLTSFSVLLQALYLAGDMDFLMSAPVQPRAVFAAKLIEALLPNYGMMCLFTLPVLYGLGISAGYQLLYYPAVLLLLAVLTLAAAGLASLLVMAAVRIFPARRMAEMLGFTVGIGMLVFSQSTRFMNFDINPSQVTALIALSEHFNQPWSPLAWAGRGLVALGKGEWLAGLGLLGLVLGLAGGAFYLSLSVAEQLYFSGWAGLQNNRRRGRAPRAPVQAAARPGLLASLLPGPLRAVLVKDLLLYRRDLRSLSRLITPLILGAVYAVSLVQSGGRFPRGMGEAPPWLMETLDGLLLYGDVALALFVGWLLAANLAGQGVSMEGRSYWMIKAAPLSPRQFLAAKFLAAYLPGGLVCGGYVLVLQFLKGPQLGAILVSLVAVELLLAGVNGIYLAFGVTGARFDWESPNQIGRAAGCLGMLAGTVYLPICFGLFAGPVVLGALLGLPTFLGQLAGLFLGGAAGLGGALIPLALVEKRAARLNEV